MNEARSLRSREKSELVDLNKRLEFYILKIRERDAAEASLRNEVDVIRKHGEKELQRQHAQHESELRILRTKRDELALDLESARQHLEKVSRENADFKKEIQGLRRTSLTLGAKTSHLSVDLAKTEQKEKNFLSRIGELETAIETLNNQKQELETELDETRRSKDTERAHVLTLQHQLQDAKEEIRDLRDEQEKISKQKDIGLGSIPIFNATTEVIAPKEIVEAKYSKWSKEKEEGIADLKLAYDEKINGYRYQLETLGHEIERERQKVEAAVRDLDDQKSVTAAVSTERDTFKSRLAELEKLFESEKKKYIEIKAQDLATIKRIRAAFIRRDKEFEALMDLKIALSMELKAYRLLLEEEEQRLSITDTPSQNTTTTTSSPSTTTSDPNILLSTPTKNVVGDPDEEPFPQSISSDSSILPSSVSSSSSSSSRTSSSSLLLPPPSTSTTVTDSNLITPSQKRKRIVVGGGEEKGHTKYNTRSTTRRASVPGNMANKTFKKPRVSLPATATTNGNKMSLKQTQLSLATMAQRSWAITSVNDQGPFIMIHNGHESALSLNGWKLKTDRGFVFSFPPEWEVKSGESLRVQALKPTQSRQQELEGENKSRTPKLERQDEKNVFTTWDEKDLWDWNKNSVISLLSPQGHRVIEVNLPTDLNAKPSDNVPSKTTQVHVTTGEGEKSAQSCLVM